MRAAVLAGILAVAMACLFAAMMSVAGILSDEGLRKTVGARLAIALRGADKGPPALDRLWERLWERGESAQGLWAKAARHLRAMGERGRRQRRQGACMDELPELIDVVVLGLSAGISFDASLEIYCDRYKTMLSSLLAQSMRSWQLGFKSRREALDELAASLQSDAFTAFVNAINESLAFGAPLATTLTDQASAVRERRRSDLEEQIEKAPVKMLIPIGTLVLPAMILAIVGPLFSSFIFGG